MELSPIQLKAILLSFKIQIVLCYFFVFLGLFLMVSNLLFLSRTPTRIKEEGDFIDGFIIFFVGLIGLGIRAFIRQRKAALDESRQRVMATWEERGE